MMLAAYNVPFTMQRYSTIQAWKAFQKRCRQAGHKVGSHPVLELSRPWADLSTSLIVGDSAECLRRIEEAYRPIDLLPLTTTQQRTLDSVLDHCIQVRTMFTRMMFGTRQQNAQAPVSEHEYYSMHVVPLLHALNSVIQESGGPFVCGTRISYVDMYIYALLKDSGYGCADVEGGQLQGSEWGQYVEQLMEGVFSHPLLRDFLLERRCGWMRELVQSLVDKNIAKHALTTVMSNCLMCHIQ
jgi:glutathione S-transferase